MNAFESVGLSGHKRSTCPLPWGEWSWFRSWFRTELLPESYDESRFVWLCFFKFDEGFEPWVESELKKDSVVIEFRVCREQKEEHWPWACSPLHVSLTIIGVTCSFYPIMLTAYVAKSDPRCRTLSPLVVLLPIIKTRWFRFWGALYNFLDTLYIYTTFIVYFIFLLFYKILLNKKNTEEEEMVVRNIHLLNILKLVIILKKQWRRVSFFWLVYYLYILDFFLVQWRYFFMY